MKRATPAALVLAMACVLTTAILFLNPFVIRAQDAASSPTHAQAAPSPSTSSHQDIATSSSSDYISRAEYDKLKAEHEAMKQELEALKTAVRQMASGAVAEAPPKKSAAPPAEGPSEGKQLTKATTPPAVTPTESETVSAELSGPLATHSFSVVGDAEVQFGKISHQHGAFMLADFAPIFLFRGGDKILFEAGFDYIIQNNAPGGSGYTTTLNLSFATLDYLINDYVTFMGGNMLLPLGTYSERSAGWLNKFPDAPLPRSVLPGNGVGVQLRGAIPIGDRGTSVTYSAFVVNGPGSVDGTGNADQLDLGGNVGLTSDGRFANTHGGAGEGGRIAVFWPWKPTYDLEVGVSGMSSPWDNAGRRQYNAFVTDWALHISPYVEIKGEYMNTWVGTDNVGTIDPDGWWVQGGYKLSGLKLNIPYLDKLELVGRYDTVDDGLGSRTHRGTVGGVYYITNTLWIEGDYEFTSNHGPNPAAPDDSLLFQISYGF
jgi:HAMP domain-containing protein